MMFAIEFAFEFELFYSDCRTIVTVQIIFYGNDSPIVTNTYGDNRTIISKCKYLHFFYSKIVLSSPWEC